MNNVLLWGAAIAVVVGIGAALWGRRATPLKKAIAASIETQDIAPIVAAMRELTFIDSGSVWHKTLEALWEPYERELAAKLLVEAAKMHDSQVIANWTQKIAEVEPELAMKVLGRAFILEKLGLPEEAIPKAGPRPPRKGERVVSKKKPRAKKTLA